MATSYPRVFIGFDPVETVAWHTFNHSIQARSTTPVSVTPIMLSQLSMFNRERTALQSNAFSFSRWLVPYLCNYQGWAIWADCDMLCLDDINKLWELRDDRYAVMCVKHDHKPKETVKYLGNVQTQYEKKNWSSVMLFNCGKCTALSKGYVNSASGLELHQFKWLDNDELIGELPHRWNILVGYDDLMKYPNPGIYHYTSGGPYFDEYKDCDGAESWLEEWRQMNKCEQRSA